MTFVQQVRGRSPVLLVDGGDAFFGSPSKKAPSKGQELRALRTGRAILHAYNYMGYEAVTLGPGDLQYGVDRLKEFLGRARFSVVCANLVEKESGKPVFKDSVVIEKSGRRIGIYGVLLSSLNRTFKKRILGDRYELLDAVETTRKVVAELRKRCDVVIALSHVNKRENEEIARSVPGIDAVIDPDCRSGNKSIWVVEGQYLVDRFGPPILRIDGQGSRVGVFEMFFQEKENKKFSSYRGYDYPLEPQILSHPELAAIVERLKGGRQRDLKIDFDPGKVRLIPDWFLGEETCGACHQDQYDFWRGTKHSSTYAKLKETGDHLKYECVECHSLGYGLSFVKLDRVGDYKEVQCESCHGLKPDHPENPGKNRLGKVAESTCWSCHNPEFTKKEDFNYEEGLKKTACPKMVEN